MKAKKAVPASVSNTTIVGITTSTTTMPATKSVSPSSPKSPYRSPLARNTANNDRDSRKSPLACLSMKTKDEGNRFLATIYVIGSAGPLRMVIKEEATIGDVMSAALKLYAREGRLPALGFDASKFELHCTNSGGGALGNSEEIGSCGSRSFLLCRKIQVEDRKHSGSSSRNSSSMKFWRLKIATLSGFLCTLSFKLVDNPKVVTT